MRFWQLPKARPFSPVRTNVATLRIRDCICCLSVLRVVFCTGATSHSARTMAQRADQSSAQKSSNRASRNWAQLLSEVLTAGRPRRSQLLNTRAFQADSEAREVGLLWMMARRMACWACCNGNLNLVGGWTYVVPRKSMMLSHVTCSNHYNSMISSSMRRASCRPNKSRSS